MGMLVHRCHVPGCGVRVPSSMLMCRPHWDKVPADKQRAVYAGHKARGSRIDETWAAWWRAQGEAIAHALEDAGQQELGASYRTRAETFAKRLETPDE